ncbi:MAG TPA: nucleotidyltransferase family protein [Candidatus Deferrimicrobiaceae bacterium]|jgi:CTP:molybdopterin cytidylyltransferase MocA
MGRCKPLLPLGDVPAVVRCIRALREAGIEQVTVVVAAPDGEAVAATVAPLGVTVVRNRDPESDMAGSVRSGLVAIDPSTRAVMICLADHPLVAPKTIRTICAAYYADPGRIVIPVHAGRKGHPTLFPRPVIEELSGLSTLRDVVGRDAGRVRLLDVPDAGVILDMDTPADYERLKEMHAASLV